MKEKLYKLSLKGVSQDSKQIQWTIEQFAELPWIKRLCIQKSGDMYNRKYQLTVWMLLRDKWDMDTWLETNAKGLLENKITGEL